MPPLVDRECCGSEYSFQKEGDEFKILYGKKLVYTEIENIVSAVEQMPKFRGHIPYLVALK